MYIFDPLGALKAVGNLSSWSTSSFIQLMWKPPFSLNLTTAEPDIVYCVDIFNIVAEEQEKEYLITNCSVFESRYYFTVDNPDPRDLFQLPSLPGVMWREPGTGHQAKLILHSPLKVSLSMNNEISYYIVMYAH